MELKIRRITAFAVTVLMIAAVIPFAFYEESYGASVRLSSKSIVLGEGASATLRVKGTKKKVKWSSSKKSIAAVTKKGVVKGKKCGSCTIKARVAGKTLKCKVTVREPAVANAMNLRNYILKNGSKASDGGRYIRRKWTAEDGIRSCNAVIKVYKDNTEMYFEVRDDYDSGDFRTRFEMTIDIIEQKPGDIYLYYSELDGGFAEYYYGSVGYDYYFEYGSPEKTAGVTVNKYIYDDTDEETPPDEYTDAATLEADAVAGTFASKTLNSFRLFDTLFRKCGLKSRMNNLGFSRI